MATAASLMVRIGADISSLQRGISSATGQLRTLGSSIERNSQHYETIGRTAGVAATAMATGFGLAVSKAANFESTMSQVKALTGGTTGDMNRLRDAALSMGADSAFSASQVADGMTVLGSAGFSTNQIIQAMPGLLNSAAASGTDFSTTADIMISTMNGFGLQASDTARIADVLSAATNASSINMGDLGETMKYVAPVAKGAGISLEEMSAAIAIMGNAGIKGSDAGTALRASITRLLAPPKDAQAALNALGIQVTDTAGNMLPFGNIMGQLSTKFAGLSQEQKAQAASAIFGQEAMSGMLTIIDAGPAKLAEMTNQMLNSKGSAEAMAATMRDNLKGSLDELYGSLETLAISVGSTLSPYLRTLADNVKGVANWFNQLSPTAQKVVIGIGAVGTAITALVAGLALLAPGITALVVGFGTVGAPILAVTAAIVGITAAGVLLYQNWDKLSNSKFLTLGSPIGGVTAAIKGLQYAFSSSIPQVDLFGSKVSATTQKSVTSLMSLSKQGTEQINLLSWSGQTVSSEMANKITSTFSDMSNQVVTALEGQKTKGLASMTSFFNSSTALSTSEEAKILSNMTTSYDQRIQKTQEGNARIAEIMKTASAEKRSITDAEKAEINRIQQEMVNNGVKAMSQSEVEQRTILERLKTNSGSINAQMAADTVASSIKQRDERIKQANATYNGTIAEIIRMRDESGVISAEQATKLINDAKKTRDETVTSARDMHGKVVTEAKAQSGEHVNQVNWETGQVRSKWDTFKTDLASKWTSMKTDSIQKAKDLGTGVTNMYENMRKNGQVKSASMKSNMSTTFSSIKSDVTSKATSLASSFGSKMESMRSNASTKFSNILSTGSSKFSSLRSSIGSAMDSVSSKVKGIVDRIRGFFTSLRLKIPTPSLPKLPHFKLKTASKVVLGKTITYPTGFSVQWYEKGGIFNGPSVIGVGEGSAPEAVVPLSGHRMRPFAQEIARQMGGSGGGNGLTIHVENMQVRNDRDIEEIAQQLYRLQQRNLRASGVWG